MLLKQASYGGCDISGSNPLSFLQQITTGIGQCKRMLHWQKSAPSLPEKG